MIWPLRGLEQVDIGVAHAHVFTTQRLDHRMREKLLGHFRPLISHFGLTEQQWRILRTLGEMKQLEPRQLCALCHILSPSLAGVLAYHRSVAHPIHRSCALSWG